MDIRPLSFRARPLLASGFSLLEVLVALVIISIGLLGVAKMHALAIGDTRISGSRAVAAIYAGSLSSAMHANQAFWQSNTLAPGTYSVSSTGIGDTPTITSTPAAVSAATVSCAYSAANPSPTACTETQMAAHDLRTWGTSLQQLPGGQGSVSCTAASTNPVTCTITITWSEKYIAANQSTVNTTTNQVATQNFVALVQP